ncbi:hypothetical protein LY78DRAFT_687109 [Colletotrichum sublineola]|nr:hypothetical protein LY78DRAFT_687109 [Colletotrichum sublineola]
MQIRITITIALAVSFAAAVPLTKLNSVETRQSTEFGPYPIEYAEDDQPKSAKKRQSTEFGPYPIEYAEDGPLGML